MAAKGKIPAASSWMLRKAPSSEGEIRFEGVHGKASKTKNFFTEFHKDPSLRSLSNLCLIFQFRHTCDFHVVIFDNHDDHHTLRILYFRIQIENATTTTVYGLTLD